MKRLCVIAFESTDDMSTNDELDLFELLELLRKKYHFRWNQTNNPLWVRALADEMEAEKR